MVYNGKPYWKWMIWGFSLYFWKRPHQSHLVFSEATGLGDQGVGRLDMASDSASCDAEMEGGRIQDLLFVYI